MIVKVEDLRIWQVVYYNVDYDFDESEAMYCVSKIVQISLHDIKVASQRIVKIQNVYSSRDELKEAAKEIIINDYQSRFNELNIKFKTHIKYLENY